MGGALPRDIGSFPGSNLSSSFTERPLLPRSWRPLSPGALRARGQRRVVQREPQEWGAEGDRADSDPNSNPKPNPTSQREPEVSTGSSGRAGPHSHLFLEILGWNRLRSVHWAPGTGTENKSGLHFSLQPSQTALLEGWGAGVRGRMPRHPRGVISGQQKHKDFFLCAPGSQRASDSKATGPSWGFHAQKSPWHRRKVGDECTRVPA